MKNSLTLEEGLTLLAIREVLVQKGRGVYSKIEASASRLQIQPELGAFLVNLASIHHVPNYIGPRLIINDPWDDVVEKLIGRRFPKKGMASYFITYLAALDLFRQEKESQTKIESEFHDLEEKNARVRELLKDLAMNLGCSVDQIPEEMRAWGYPEEESEYMRKTLDDIRQAEIDTQKIRKEAEDLARTSFVYYSKVAAMEDLVKFPKLSEGRLLVFWIMRMITNFASQADFDLARSEAEQFIASPEGTRKILLLSRSR